MRLRLQALAAILPLVASFTTACSDSTAATSSAVSITAQAGNGQIDSVTGTLPIPLEVLVTNSAGGGVPNVTVNWVPSDGVPIITSVVTDANGLAQLSWTLGVTAETQTMTVTVSGLPAVAFTATATAGSPEEVVQTSGDVQSATRGTTLKSPLVVEVIDQYGNLVSNATVMWAITVGGGVVSTGTTNGTTVTTTTGADGLTQAAWTIGTVGSNTVTATVGTLTPVSFGATGL